MKYLIAILITWFALASFESAQAEVIWYPQPVEAYKFAEEYPEAQNLLFAFDYGHALVYEKLLLNRGKISDPEAFEKELLVQIQSILKNPPTTKTDESDIAPQYVFTFPKILNLFDWSHQLHQFVLDVLASSKDRGPAMTKRIEEIFSEYKAKKQIAITDVCKTMQFMDGHYFSKSFRRKFPSFNLLIWSYHWFQIRLYEDLMLPSKSERDLAVQKTLKEFRLLISDLPDSAEFDMMPETAKVAPNFAKMFPTIPAAFDNNHMLHDIVSDLLTSEKVSDSQLRSEGTRMANMNLDPNAFRATTCNSN